MEYTFYDQLRCGLLALSIGRSYRKEGKHPVHAEGTDETWEAPPAGVIKINIDASLVNRELRGLSAVLRDHLGGLVASDCAKMAGN